MANELTCKDCPYCYKGFDDDFPCCHWYGDSYDPYDKAPCEEDEYDEDDE